MSDKSDIVMLWTIKHQIFQMSDGIVISLTNGTRTLISQLVLEAFKFKTKNLMH